MLLRSSAAILLVGATLAGTPAEAKNDDVGAAIAAGIIGLAAGAILASAGQNENHRPHDNHVRPPHNPGPYSPKRGIVCYPKQRVCQDANHRFKPGWTAQEFGR